MGGAGVGSVFGELQWLAWGHRFLGDWAADWASSTMEGWRLGLRPGWGVSMETYPSHFVGQAGLPGVSCLPQVTAEILSFYSPCVEQAQLKGYNQNTTLCLSASIL